MLDCTPTPKKPLDLTIVEVTNKDKVKMLQQQLEIALACLEEIGWQNYSWIGVSLMLFTNVCHCRGFWRTMPQSLSLMNNQEKHLYFQLNFVNDNAKPSFYQARKVPHALRSKIEQELDRLRSVTTMLNSLNWPTLESHRLYSKLVIFYKIINGYIEIPSISLFPMLQTTICSL